MSCAWCAGPIPPRARIDALTCSKRCRQARHRFTTALGHAEATNAPLRFAYADPPYPGLSARYYSRHPDYAGEVDHAELINTLTSYDGWALSTSAAALPEVLRLCPPTVRIAAWFRGPRNTPSTHARSSWEPVIYTGDRPDLPYPYASPCSRHDTSPAAGNDTSQPGHRDPSTAGPRDASPDEFSDYRKDSLIYPAKPRTSDPARVIGTKPATFCRWMFQLLGARRGDTLDDLYPGSAGISRAWSVYTANPPVAADTLPTGPTQR